MLREILLVRRAQLVGRRRDAGRVDEDGVGSESGTSDDDDAANFALVNALLGRTPSPTKRKAEEPDTQYLDSPGFLPPQEKRRKPSPKDAVVDLTAED